MGDDRRQSDVEPLGDLFIEQPLDDELQHVDFALRERRLHGLRAAVGIGDGMTCGHFSRIAFTVGVLV